jgi:hypothetical protein
MRSRTAASAASTRSIQGLLKTGQRAFNQSPVVDCAKLIHEQIGIASEAFCSRHTYPKGLGVVDQTSG